MFGRTITHLLRCCKILPNYKSGLMYGCTFQFQLFLRLAYGHFCELCSSTSRPITRFSVIHYLIGKEIPKCQGMTKGVQHSGLPSKGSQVIKLAIQGFYYLACLGFGNGSRSFNAASICSWGSS